MISTCIEPFDDGEYFDYNIWIPADEYRPLTPTPSVSSADSVTSEDELEEEKPVDLAGAFADKVDPKDVQARFKALAGGSSAMDTHKAFALARSVGLAPSREDERRLLEEHPKSVTFKELEEWLVSITHPEDDVESLCKFFYIYDKERKGKLSRQQMRHILSQIGDTLSLQEIDQLLTAAGQAGDQVDYRAVVTMLLNSK